MSKNQKLTNELDTLQTRKVFQLFMTDTTIFRGWSKEDINTLADHATVLKIFPNDRLVRKGEIVSWWGIMLNGSAFITSEFLKLGRLSSGDMIGYMGFLDLKGNQFHKFDITVDLPGYIALIFKEDLRVMQKKSPKLVYKLYQLLGLKSLDIIYYHIHSKPFNKQLKFKIFDITMKRKADMVSKLPKLSLEIISQLDKTEVKIFYTISKVINLDPKELLIEANGIEPAIFIVLRGNLVEFKEDESRFIKDGEVIGYTQFLSITSGCVWPHNVGSLDMSTVLMIHKDDFQDVINSAPMAAASIYKLFVQLFSKKLVDDKLADTNKEKTKTLLIRNSYAAGVQDFLIELDASKHSSPSKPSELRRMRSEEFSSVEKLNIFDEYDPSPEYPPLFLFNNFKDQLDLSIKKGAVI
jgi:CRP-like cAMP-binding protein